MGLEEHLLTMFRGDAEFHDGAGASHLHGHGGVPESGTTALDTNGGKPDPAPSVPSEADGQTATDWDVDATRELGKIPFFVRGKARRNTEAFARDRGVARITLETLYEAKAHYGR